jgi:osmoprotectant transport system substrate-binding protein
MRFNRARAVGAAILGLALVATACGSSGGGTKKSSGGSTTVAAKGTITIGGFNFNESSILADIYAGALQAKGYNVKTRLNLGSREVVEPALERGELDMYPGYAATELEFVDKGTGQATPDPTVTVSRLNALLAPKGLEALTPSPALDANAFAVTKATADKYHLTKLSDLAPIASRLTLGGPPECPTRPFCQPGLARVYGLHFKSFRPLDAGGPLSKNALANGDVDVALIFSSDGAIAARNFVVLQDDKHLQNADAVVPIIHTKVATAEVKSILDKVSAALTTGDLTTMNKSADIDKVDPDQLAKTWLSQHGF